MRIQLGYHNSSMLLKLTILRHQDYHLLRQVLGTIHFLIKASLWIYMMTKNVFNIYKAGEKKFDEYTVI